MTAVIASPVSALVPALAGVLAAAAFAGGGTGTAPPAPAGALTSATALVEAPEDAHAGAWPLAPRPEVLAWFARPEAAWAAGHRGVDLAGRPGQTVRSTLPGVVTYAGMLAGRGVVVVDHGGVRTTYEPVTASVTLGEEVGRASALGVLELPGGHCLPTACLHWGALRGAEYLDPLTLVSATPRPVRLLPSGCPGTP